MTTKERLSATVDADLLAAGAAAVAAGRAESLSAWVNDALRRQAEHEQGLAALDEAISAYEAEYGEITAEDIERANEHVRRHAIHVRGRAEPGVA